MLRKISFLFFLIPCFLIGKDVKITNTEELLSQMFSRYHGNFNHNITFVQINTNYKEDGSTFISSAFEAFHFPGKARIDNGLRHSVDGVVYKDDTAYHFKEGKLTHKEFYINNILLLCGDLYFLHAQKSLDKLKSLGYDVTKFREDEIMGRQCYVIGADKGDVKSPQFWVDKEFLYLLRNIYKSYESGELEDSQYTEHEIVGKSWVEGEVMVYDMKGRKIRKERYAEVSANNHNLDQKVFDPFHWGKVHWHK